jgi:hypothetical protein
MPLTSKGKEIMSSMKKSYGPKKAKQVFYASKNAGKIKGVDNGFYGHMTKMPSRVGIGLSSYGIGCDLKGCK